MVEMYFMVSCEGSNWHLMSQPKSSRTTSVPAPGVPPTQGDEDRLALTGFEPADEQPRPSAPPPRAAKPIVSTTSKVEGQLSNPHVIHLIKAGLLSPANAKAQARGAFAVVANRYELRDVLGEGGMGLVFLTYDNSGDCMVALKTLKPRFLSNEKARAQFIDEAKEMNRIPAHACVLVVKDFGSVDKPFYVTEYLTGGTIASRIRKDGPLPANLACRFSKDIARAIAFIHAKHGKMHRDIKPENVLIDDDGSARLADFGLIWNVGGGSRGLQSGTVPYMPPEVVGNQRMNVGYEWDVYSFGATLYEMLSGRAPYADIMKTRGPSTTIETLRKVISDEPPTPILTLNRQADRSLARIADWAMARDARDRYFHVHHIQADLDRVSEGKKPLGPQQRASKAPGRWSPLRRLAAAVVGVGLITAGTWYFWPVGEAISDAGPSGLAEDNDPSFKPIADSLFEQSRATSPLQLTFDTATPGLRTFRIGQDTHHFIATAQRRGYLFVFGMDSTGSLMQLYPNNKHNDNALEPGETLHIPPAGETYKVEVTGPAGIDRIKAVFADQPWEVEGVTEASYRESGYPPLERDFRIRVGETVYDSFDAAFGENWQSVEFDVTITDPR